MTSKKWNKLNDELKEIFFIQFDEDWVRNILIDIRNKKELKENIEKLRDLNLHQNDFFNEEVDKILDILEESNE